MIKTLADEGEMSAGDIAAMGFLTEQTMNQTTAATLAQSAVQPSQLGAVAFSNNYNDLANKPASGGQQVQTDWNATSGLGVLLNKPTTLPPSAHSQAWSTITATPTTLAGYGILDAYKPSGTTLQYLRGDGSLATFPTIPAAQVQPDWNAVSGLGVILNKPSIPTQKRIETYTGTTNASGQIVVTYPTAFPAVPNVQPPPPSAANQVWTLVSSTASGFTIQLNQRNVVTLLSIEVLLGATVPVVGASAQVLVVAQ